MDEVIRFYELVDEELRFQKNSRKIEFLTSIHALTPLVQNRAKILDLGAGTGAYSFHFAEMGHEVTAVDLTPKNIQTINEKKRQYDSIRLEAMIGDATDLCMLESSTYDVVLCFGPYYHIINAEVRKKLIQESLRVLQPGGILAIAYINKYSVIPMLAKKMPAFLNERTISKVITQGYLKGGDPDSFWTDSYYTSPFEIVKYMADYGVELLDHLGTDGLSHTLSDEIDTLSEEKFQIWLKYHMETCREGSILGMSSHGLYICRK